MRCQMEPYVLKNILKNIVFFLEYNKPFVIQDEEHNQLDFFLVELNRYRQLAGLDTIVVEKRINLPYKVPKRRFIISRPLESTSEKDFESEEDFIVEANCPEPDSSSSEQVSVRITKAKFKELMDELFGDSLSTIVESAYDIQKEKNIKRTKFYLGDECVGVWAVNRGIYIRN